ncbi:hypothetical protein IFT54_11645 [Sphingomonas sp. CFBP 13714]|uniref:hypothetical protein n=1 Tax=Sphingomonas sp. CFBP 13714 TaxID=2775308 RepID=UPI001784F253|nr:hypothetical protein [Sphingomonas sp. CFBP 13714]MBD8700474.1 hypothetical protein [Sphingomonas sp. CFBP 13714]
MLRHSRTSYRSCTSYPFRDDPATGVVDATVDLRPLFAWIGATGPEPGAKAIAWDEKSLWSFVRGTVADLA